MSDYASKIFPNPLIRIIFALISLQITNLVSVSGEEPLAKYQYNKTCWPLNQTLFSRCARTGINSSFVHSLLPFRDDETELSIARILMKQITTFAREKNIGNCSALNTDLLLCSFHLPQCRKEDEKAILPCRRVCQEFVKDCGENLSLDLLDYFVAVCHFLPEKHDCIEPPGFKPKYNLSDALGQTCAKVTTPQCKALGSYNYTIASQAMQHDAEHIINDILATETETCRPVLTKFLCAELVSPCFPDADKPAIYLPCNTTCHQISKICPTFISHYTKYFHECEEHPPGNGDKGFCKIDHWNQLLDVFFTHKRAVKSHVKRKTPSWKILTGVLVPLAVLTIIIIVVSVVILKRRRLNDGFQHKILDE